jgi:mono/diheme cytochrome c family protein
MKRRIPYALTLTLALLLSGIALAQKATPAKPSVPKGWSFSFPDGDPNTGKQLYVQLECYACHTIKLPKESLAARPGKVGPELTGYSVLPKEYLASSIIKAHTVVAAPGYTVKDGKAGMGNYNHFLTVQELIDLVAFLNHSAATPAK